MKPRKIIIVYVLIIAILLFAGALYYYRTQNDDVGINGGDGGVDANCGLFSSEEERNACCAELHKDDITIACVGTWQYIEKDEVCEYVCTGGEILEKSSG